MRKSLITLAAVLAMTAAPLLCPASAHAQKVIESSVGRGGSPHETVEYTVNDATIRLTYGRPFLKGRSLETLAPTGKVYRTGADAATTIQTSKALKIGTLDVPAGTYTLYTLPGETWQLIVNKQTGQWGTDYDEKQDLGRTPMTAGTASSPAENLTLTIENGQLKLHWGTMTQSVPLSVQ